MFCCGLLAYVAMSVVHQPLPEVQQPLPAVQQPLPQVQQPLPQVQQPLPQVQQPLPQVQQPLSQVQQPLPQVQQPLSQVQQPLSGVDNNNSGMLLMLLWLPGTSSTEIIIHDMTVSVKYIADICNYGVCICSYGRFYLMHSRVKNHYSSELLVNYKEYLNI